MLKEFREFALKGNVLDLAIGVIVGGAFGKIVTSLVNDVLMPPLGLVVGKVDFSNLFINLSGKPVQSVAEAKAAGIPTLNYGLFLNNVLDFVIVAFTVFLMVKAINRIRRKEEKQEEVTHRDCPYCLSSIPLKATRCAHCTSAVSAASQF